MTGFSLTGVQRQTRSPLATDDINAGAQPGYVWVDTTTQRLWICASNTASAASWVELGAGNNIPFSETVQTGRRVSTMANRSGTITSAGVAQVLAAENLDRRGFWVQNVSTGDLWISTVASASAEQPSMLLKPNTFFEMPPDAVATNAISIFGATAGQAFSAREWN